MNDTDDTSLVNVANMIAKTLDQLTHDYYNSTYTDLTSKKAPIAKVVPGEDSVSIQVRGSIIFEFGHAISEAGLDEQLEMEDEAPQGTIPLRANEYITLTLHSKEEALKLATALIRFPFSVFVENYLKDPVNGAKSLYNDPEILAQITAKLISDIRQHANDYGAGNILDALEEKSPRDKNRSQER